MVSTSILGIYYFNVWWMDVVFPLRIPVFPRETQQTQISRNWISEKQGLRAVAQAGSVESEVGFLMIKKKKGHRYCCTRWFKPWPKNPLVGGHQQPLKGSLNHPKKVTKNCQLDVLFFGAFENMEYVKILWSMLICAYTCSILVLYCC